MKSIWQDYIVDFGNVSEVTYDLRIGSTTGTIIYTGHAYKRPGESTLKVKINGPIADYLANLPRLDNTTFAGLTLPLTIYVMCSVGAFSDDYNADYNLGTTYTEYEHETFINDWSYDNAFVPAWNQRLSFPINGRVDIYTPILFTTCATSETVTFFKADGTQLTSIVMTPSTSRSNDFQRDITSAGKGTIYFTLADAISPAVLAQVGYFTIGTIRYDLVRDCNRYSLCYRNPYGGWDTFLVEGNALRTDEQTASTYTKENANNYYPQNRETLCYINKVTPTWAFNTHAMTDSEAAFMHYLLESPSVYLFDNVRNYPAPVIITDTAVQHQDFKANGCKLSQFAINVRSANPQTRR